VTFCHGAVTTEGDTLPSDWLTCWFSKRWEVENYSGIILLVKLKGS